MSEPSPAGKWILEQYQLSEAAATASEVPTPYPAPYSPPSSRRSPKVFGWIAAALVAVGGVGIPAYLGLHEHHAEQQVTAYTSGTGGATFISPDGGFSATFPSQPSRSERTIDLPKIGGQQNVTLWSSGSKRNMFGVMVLDLPPGTDYNFSEGLDGAAAAVDGQVVQSRVTSFDGHEAGEGVVRARSGYYVKALIVPTPSRLYTLLVAASQDPPPGYDKFKSSFAIGDQASSGVGSTADQPTGPVV
jgi:hypothetical protein